MSFRSVLSSLGLSEPSVNKALGESTLGYRKTLADILDSQIEDHLFEYKSGMGTMYCLSKDPKIRSIELTRVVGGKSIIYEAPLTKISMNQIAIKALGNWARPTDVEASLQKGASFDLRTVESRIAKNFIPDSISAKGTRKDIYNYLQKYGIVTEHNGKTVPSGNFTLFYDPATYKKGSSGKSILTKKDAFVVTKTLNFNGQEYSYIDKDGVKRPYQVQTTQDSLSRLYLGLCLEAGDVIANLPVFITVINRESNLTLNMHRIEIGQALSGKDEWSNANVTDATSFGLTQVLGLTKWDKSPYSSIMWQLLGLNKYPTLDHEVWNSLDKTLAMGVINFILYIDLAKSSDRSVFVRYAGAGSGTESKLGSMDLPTSWGWDSYAELMNRALMERSLTKYLSKT